MSEQLQQPDVTDEELHHDACPKLYALFRETIKRELRKRAKVDLGLLAVTVIFGVLSPLHPFVLYLTGLAVFLLFTYGWKTLYYWYALKNPEHAWRMMTRDMLDVTPMKCISDIEHELANPILETEYAIVTQSWIVVKSMLPAGGIASILDIKTLWIEHVRGAQELRLYTKSKRTLITHGTDRELSAISGYLERRKPGLKVNYSPLIEIERMWSNHQ